MSWNGKELQVIIDGLERQGTVVKPTRKGLMFNFPNGGSMVVHHTQSDRKAIRNVRARVLRAGLEWPLDGKKPQKREGKRMTDPRAEVSIEKIERALDVGQVQEPFQLVNLSQATGLSTATVRRHVVNMGFVYEKHGDRGTFWRRRPEPVTPTPAEDEEYPEIARARELLAAQRDTSEPQSVGYVDQDEETEQVEQVETPEPVTEATPEVEAREFIDSCDSWTVDVPEELRRVADMMGLEIEVRVWRR